MTDYNLAILAISLYNYLDKQIGKGIVYGKCFISSRQMQRL